MKYPGYNKNEIMATPELKILIFMVRLDISFYFNP